MSRCNAILRVYLATRAQEEVTGWSLPETVSKNTWWRKRTVRKNSTTRGKRFSKGSVISLLKTETFPSHVEMKVKTLTEGKVFWRGSVAVGRGKPKQRTHMGESRQGEKHTWKAQQGWGECRAQGSNEPMPLIFLRKQNLSSRNSEGGNGNSIKKCSK